MLAFSRFADVERMLARRVTPSRHMGTTYKLDTMRKLMHYLGDPQDTYKVIHVAGTSGKTSTAYYAASLLQQAGQCVGLSVSPHTDCINERVQINLEPLAEQQYCQRMNEFMKLVARSGTEPTYFELLVAFAYWTFAELDVDYAVIEVGLGGLLDGTNVITRSDKVSIITDIGLDHVNVLGDNLRDIARQKAGIILPNSDVFCLEQSNEVNQVFTAEAARHKARLHQLHYKPEQTTSLLPLFQQRNWSLASQAVRFTLKRDGRQALTAAQLKASTSILVPGRMEMLRDSRSPVILDGAHNAQKMQALVASLQARFPGHMFAVLLALSDDKNLHDVLQTLQPITSHLIITAFVAGQDVHKTPAPPADIEAVCRTVGIESFQNEQDIEQAYHALQQRPETHRLVTGSLYLLHDVRKLVKAL